MDVKSLIGSTIADKYALLKVAGEGGMGTVFQATHLELHRLVAVKILDPALVSDDDATRRFEREAKAISQLSHAHKRAESALCDKFALMLSEKLKASTISQ